MIITSRHVALAVLFAGSLHLLLLSGIPAPARESVSPPEPMRFKVALVETTPQKSKALANTAAPAPPLPPEPPAQPLPQPAPPVKPMPRSAPVAAKPPPPAAPTPRKMQTKKPQANPVIKNPPEVPVDRSPPRVDRAPLVQEALTEERPKATPVPEATAQYKQQLRAWLEKHKKYPSAAKRLRIQGQGVLRIRIDRSGNLLHVSLEQPTGNRLLDKAALAMAKRANPFPVASDHPAPEELELLVPVGFILR